MAVLPLAGACGDDDDSSAGADGDEVTVETGSLSKAGFVKRTGAMCKEVKEQVLRDYAALFEDQAKSSQPEGAKTARLVNTVLVPSYEELIDRISSLGAPSGDEEQVAGFLSGLQQDLDYAQDQPSKALNRLTPFTRSAKLATRYGLDGCADSLS